MRNSSHGAPELLTKHNENCAQWLTNFSHQLRIEMRITKSRISDEQEHSTQQLNNLESLACKLLSKSENKQFHTGDHAGRYNLLLSKLITLTTQTSPGKVSVFTAHELQVVARAVYLTQVDFHQITPVKAATNLLKIGSISIVSTQPITRSVSDRKKRRSPSPTEERGHFIRAKRMLNLMRDHPMATTCLPWKPDDRFHHSRQ